MSSLWDVVVVGAGPAGSAAAIGVLGADPSLRVALVDRSAFPRDKACGDGIAPHVFDLLTEAGVTGVVDDWAPVHRLRLSRGGRRVEGAMRRPTWVVPRTVFDARLVEAAQEAGAELVQHRVSAIARRQGALCLDGTLTASVVIGADGARSAVAKALDRRPGRMAVALRGYAPVPPERAGAQVIEFGSGRQPAYAWSFDRGDGLANIGYGELLPRRRTRPTRLGMLEQLEALLPGSTAGATDWRGHQLPLSTPSWRPPHGPVLLAGDAAGLVNPMTGEGIFYAVATGLAAGRAAAEALVERDPASAGGRYSALTRPLLVGHLRHIGVAATLCRSRRVLDAGIQAAATDKDVFDDLVELGLARGRITPRVLRGLAVAMTGRLLHSPSTTPREET